METKDVIEKLKSLSNAYEVTYCAGNSQYPINVIRKNMLDDLIQEIKSDVEKEPALSAEESDRHICTFCQK